MTVLRSGFFVEQIAVRGTGELRAAIECADGLTVISGASDTGKSYVRELIDFAFGAKDPPRTIAQAAGYDRVVLRIRSRASRQVHEIERSLAGGDVTLRTFGEAGTIILEERVASAKHAAGDHSTLSAFLLSLSGFGEAMLRRKKSGETRTLSFRDVAFLAIVDEGRIISEEPPHRSGNKLAATSEGDVLRLMVTGVSSATPISSRKKSEVQGAKAQLLVIDQLLARVDAEIASLELGETSVVDEIARLDQSTEAILQSYEASRVELVEQERQLADLGRDLRAAESRLAVVEGLNRRFELLHRHYDSDIQRLNAIEEAGSLLGAMPATSCPVCGAPPSEHRSGDSHQLYRLDDVRAAARRESEKTSALREDLANTLRALDQEARDLEDERSALRARVKVLQRMITEDARPRLRATSEFLQAQSTRRDLLLRGRVLSEEREELRRRRAELAVVAKSKSKDASVSSNDATAAIMNGFAQQVQEVLTAWNFPDAGRVVFSEATQDLVIGGQPRASHGKGVRALTCAAFIAALMKHCLSQGLPHPGMIALDSPLVAYKDPDVPGTESAKLRKAGVKDAFYHALAAGLCIGQVIVFENEDPPDDFVDRLKAHHFTKSSVGRYGFFQLGR
jgi:hypothetical protein